MPITVDALVVGLTAGVKTYSSFALQFTGDDATYGTTFSRHFVQIYGSAVTNAQNLHDGSSMTTSVMTAPATTGAAAPNFQVKSYLNAPVVCPVATTGTVTKIAFALAHESRSGSGQISTTSETTTFTTTSGNTAGGFCNGNPTIPYVGSSDTNFGDIYMVITLSPGIAVTAGGYLTVKGWASGVSGSDSFTYVTLQSGS